MGEENPLVYLNGQFLPLDQAKISVLDRGFLFGDGVYEVIPVYGGRPFRFKEHLRRLENSLHAIRMQPPLSDQQWQEALARLIRGAGDQSVYLQITRGAADKRDHAMPAEPKPTVFAMCTPIEPIAPMGVCAITLEDTRWKHCHIKAITLLANILLRQQALDQGCAETILVRDGHITEGAASNIFAVIDNTLLTPPKSHELLPGITRDLLLELARAHGIPAKESLIPLANFQKASEIWLTSSTREILPVVKLDGQPVGRGQSGPLWRKMYEIFQDYKRTFSLQA